ncbi:MAG: hypothetical protein MJ211_01625 [Bacteroidales bacterium]|nr:hypothetical protein [Bacteroidales bacterium]
MKVIFFVLILLFFASCSQKQTYYPVPDEVTMLIEDNMPEVETFTLEKISLPTKYQNSKYFVYDDSLVVILNNSNPNPYLVSVYNLNTKQEIAGYFKKGNGPNEFMNLYGYSHNKNLLLQDGNLHALTQLNIDSIILKGNNYIPKITYHDAQVMTDFVFLGNDTIVSANGMFIKGFGVDNVSEFELYDANTGKALQKYPQNEKNFPPNAVYRTITYSNSKFVVFWSLFPVISIYDKNFNIIKQYRDAKFKDCLLTIQEEEFNNIKSVDDFLLYFTFGCETDNFIVASNYRYNIKREMINPQSNIDFSKDYEMWIFDTDMNFKRRLKPKNSVNENIWLVSYCENSNNFYLTCTDEDEEFALYKCILK